MTPVFNNFDLHIGQGTNGIYPVSVQYSPAGETASPVLVKIVHDSSMEEWLEELQDGLTKQKELQALARRLAAYLLPFGPVRDLYQRSLGMVEARGEFLRLRLRISPPELAAWPWEYAYNDELDDFLLLNPRTVLVRYHNQPISPRSITSLTPVPILLLIANPLSTEPLAVGKETGTIIRALSHLLDKEQVKLDILFSGTEEERKEIEDLTKKQQGVRLLSEPASVDGLRDALRQGYRVLHYIGHAVFDEETGGALLLVDDNLDDIPIKARTLARELAGHTVSMVVLNACQSATESTAQSFMGLAANLIRIGVPAVVAMQYPILDHHALHFSRALYKALADGWPLDAAVTEGRKAIAAQITEDEMDWGIPVLFMRSNDGILWEEKEENMDQAKSITTDSTPLASSSDTITATISGIGAGAQIAVGKQIKQTITQAPNEQSVSNVVEISHLLAQLKSELAGLSFAQHKKIIAHEFIEQLEEELTKQEQPPDGSVIKVAGNWLLKNIPALRSTLDAFFLNPVVRKVVAAAHEPPTG